MSIVLPYCQIQLHLEAGRWCQIVLEEEGGEEVEPKVTSRAGISSGSVGVAGIVESAAVAVELLNSKDMKSDDSSRESSLKVSVSSS